MPTHSCDRDFFRALKEQRLLVRDFTTLEELAEALEEFPHRYNDRWLLEKFSF